MNVEDEPSAFTLIAQGPDMSNRPFFLEPLSIPFRRNSRSEIVPFDIPWEEGAPRDEILEKPDQGDLLMQIKALFQEARKKQVLWNLNAANLYLLNGRLTFIRPEGSYQFNEKTLQQMALTYHCSQGDEVYRFIIGT
jgi:hypothetical protein